MTTPSGPTEAHRNTFTACFSVVAESDPNTLSRVLEPFTKRGLVPASVYAIRVGRTGEAMHVDLQLADADAETTRRIAGDLRRQWLVDTVLTSEKRMAEPAIVGA